MTNKQYIMEKLFLIATLVLGGSLPVLVVDPTLLTYGLSAMIVVGSVYKLIVLTK